MKKLYTIAAACAVALASITGSALAEEKVGSTVESRVLLGFKVDETALGDWLPGDWTPVTLGQGPLGGSNLIMALIDRHAIHAADGAPASPASGPIVAFLVYGKSATAEGVRGFVTRVYEEAPVESPYGNSLAADIDRVSSFTDPGGPRTLEEKWTIRADDGALEIDLTATVRGFRWSTGGESRPHSSVTPDFFRIYRYDQLAGLAQSSGMNVPLNGTVSVSTTAPELAAILDGNQTPTAIVMIPVYLREIFLP